MAAANLVNSLPVQNVKLHHLHVLSHTALAEDYARGAFVPLEQSVYFQRCTVFLAHLRPDIAVHRLAAFSPRNDELIAPSWSNHKMGMYQGMLDHMRAKQVVQGQEFYPKI